MRVYQFRHVGQRRRDYSGIIPQVNLTAAHAALGWQKQMSAIGWKSSAYLHAFVAIFSKGKVRPLHYGSFFLFIVPRIF